MSKSPELWLPEVYEARMTDKDHDVHERLATTSLDTFVDGMSEPIDYQAADWTARFVHIRNPQDEPAEQTVVVAHPFGNAYTPAQHIRWATMQAMMPVPTDVIAFPNNDAKNEYQSRFSFRERQVSNGDSLHIMGSRILEIVRSLDLERLGFVGDSQGASVLAETLTGASDLDVRLGANLAEPANLVRRTSMQLQLAFMREGTKLAKAVNDSGIPALSEAQHSRGIRDMRYMPADLWAVWRGSQDANNKALQEAMTNPTFTNARYRMPINVLNAGVRVSFMEDSLIATDEGVERVAVAFNQAGPEIIKGYGHVGMDNVVLRALMARHNLRTLQQ